MQRIAEFTAKCEKYVGTESGGMDQAISIMGEKGLAKLVHFKPVSLSVSEAIHRHSQTHAAVNNTASFVQSQAL